MTSPFVWAPLLHIYKNLLCVAPFIKRPIFEINEFNILCEEKRKNARARTAKEYIKEPRLECARGGHYAVARLTAAQSLERMIKEDFFLLLYIYVAYMYIVLIQHTYMFCLNKLFWFEIFKKPKRKNRQLHAGGRTFQMFWISDDSCCAILIWGFRLIRRRCLFSVVLNK